MMTFIMRGYDLDLSVRAGLLAASLSLITSAAHSAPEPINLLTENFPPYNMAVDGKNFGES